MGLLVRQPRQHRQPCRHRLQARVVADLKAAVGKAMTEYPLSEFVDPAADAPTVFLSQFSSTFSHDAMTTLRPKYGRVYGFEFATPPNAEMVVWTLFEYR